ncbi:MAG TPA: hypothetical protein VHW65_12235 [Gemmatimonadales bacterium]|nr:hypothetical protein [Gemmatimonadales bacterium]
MPAPTLRPLSVGEVLDVAFGLYRAKFAPLVVIAVVCRVLPEMFNIYLQLTGPLFAHLVLLLLLGLLSVVLAAIAVGASTYLVADAYLDRDLSAGDALRKAMGIAGRLMVVGMLFSLGVGLGFILFIIPGFFLLSGLVLSTPIAVLEPDVRTVGTLDRSWQLTRGHRGKVFLTMLVAMALIIVPSVAAFAVGLFAGMMLSLTTRLIVSAVVSGVVGVFVTPYIYVVLTVLYYDLRVRKEGFDLEVLTEGLEPA